MATPATARRDGLRRDEILAAALALADERGLEAVSMRAVAARVGITPMALYRHVGDKQGLLDGLIGRLLADLPLPDPALPWADRLRAFAAALRAAAREHPSLFALLVSRPVVEPGALRVIEALYALLRDAGVPDPEVPRLERLVATFALGWLASEAGGRFGPGSAAPRARRARLTRPDFPAHHALAPHLDARVDWDAEFAADVEDLIRLVAGLARTE
jgi:AcrR family transcriptional regulator